MLKFLCALRHVVHSSSENKKNKVVADFAVASSSFQMFELFRALDVNACLKFPGWEVYQGAHILARLDKEADFAVRGDLRKTWMSRRHVRIGQASPAIAEQLSEMARG